jgi:cell division protein FtsW (lipid II flippase)
VDSQVARARRSTELGLVLLSAAITAAAFVLASLGENASMPARIIPFLLFVLSLVLGAHVVVRFVARGADPLLLPTAAFLHGLGYVMISRLSDRWAGLQATWSLIGITAFAITLLVLDRPADLRRWQWTSLGAGLILLLLPMVPGLGFTSGGARIWVSVGPINFQPGEFAKILLTVFFAAYLAERGHLIVSTEKKFGISLPDPRHLAPIVLAWMMSVVVMVGQRDLGSSLLFFTLFVVMIWIATERTSFLVFGFGLFAAGAVVAHQLFSHVQTRVDIWLNPWDQYTGRGYQPIQALFALANGGMTGTGLGLGSPGAIPAAHNDFIFAAIGEELGMLGGVAILSAFVLLVGAGMRTALRAQSDFEKLLATGLTTIAAVQTFIIIGGVLRVVPLTGVTLPFMSYGGSSLVANYVLLAILIRVSDHTSRTLHEIPFSPSPRERFITWRLKRAAS